MTSVVLIKNKSAKLDQKMELTFICRLKTFPSVEFFSRSGKIWELKIINFTWFFGSYIWLVLRLDIPSRISSWYMIFVAVSAAVCITANELIPNFKSSFLEQNDWFFFSVLSFLNKSNSKLSCALHVLYNRFDQFWLKWMAVQKCQNCLL